MRHASRIATWISMGLGIVLVFSSGPTLWTLFPLLSFGAALVVFHGHVGSERWFIAVALCLNLLLAAALTFVVGVWIGSGAFDSRLVDLEAALGAVFWIAPLLNVLQFLREWRGHVPVNG
jgi:hypothetical protein